MNEYYGVDLFADIAAVEVVRLVSGDWVAFAVDPIWCRVVAANYETGDIVAYGEEGTGDGELMWPEGVAADSLGNVIVSDTGNDRLVRLFYDGASFSFVSYIGDSYGLSEPRGIELMRSGSPDARIYVADTGNSRVVRFSLDGQFIASSLEVGVFPGPPAPFSPVDVAVEEYAGLEVLDGATGRLVYFIDMYDELGDPELWYDGELDLSQFGRPCAVDADCQNVYVVDKTRALIAKRLYIPWDYDPEYPCFYLYGSHGFGMDQLYYPNGVSRFYPWNLVGVTEEWTNRSGPRELIVDLEIRNLSADPSLFDPNCGQRAEIEFIFTDCARMVDVVVVARGTSDTVRTLWEDAVRPSGYNRLYWDGKDDSGTVVPPGWYDIVVSGEDCYGEPYQDEHPTKPCTTSVSISNLAGTEGMGEERFEGQVGFRICVNPAMAACEIVFGVASMEPFVLGIYSVDGRLIRMFTNEDTKRTSGSIRWDGTDWRGVHVAPVIYFCRLTSGNTSITKKLLLLR